MIPSNKSGIYSVPIGSNSVIAQVPIPTVSISQVATPQVAIPQVATPKVTIPQVAIPQVAIPQVNIPKLTTSKISIPQVATPKATIPQVATPKVPIPQVATPQVTIPKISIPQVAIPQVNIPKTSIPQVATPKIPTAASLIKPITIPNGTSGIEQEFQEIELRPRQLEWANRAYNILLHNYGYIDTSRMGSGKTFVLIWLAKAIGIRLLIVCPVIMQNVWKSITETYGIPTIGIISYASLRSKRGYQPSHIFLRRHDGITEQGTKTLTFTPTQEYLRLVDEGIMVVFDEMQNIKNKSAQYKAAAALLHPIILRGGASRFALLSGTPFDEEEHAINLLKLIGYIRSPRLYYYDTYTHTTVLEGMGELINACNMINPQETQLILEEIPPDRGNIPKLAYALYIRVIKPNISGSMPPPDIHGFFDIKNGFFNINPNSAAELRAAISELAGVLSLAKLAAAVEMNVPYAQLEGEIDETKIPETTNLGAITHALVKIENAKITDMARVAEGILLNAPNSKVIISVNYTSTLRSLAFLLHQYNPLLLYGKVKRNQRTQIINLFNTNPNYRVLIMNTSVGGVGISLHDTIGNAPRYMLISPSYKLLEIIQAASRIYRDGTMSDAVVRVFYGKGNVGVEIGILNALARKTEVLKGVIDEHFNNYLLLPGEYPAEEEL